MDIGRGREWIIWSGVSTVQKPLYEKVEYIIPPCTNKTKQNMALIPRSPTDQQHRADLLPNMAIP